MIKLRNNFFKYKENTDSIQIIPTWRCNYNCAYCFNRQKDMTMDMSKASWKIVMKYLKTIKRDVLDISFFGGEPSTNENLLFFTEDLYSEFGESVNITIQSNFSKSFDYWDKFNKKTHLFLSYHFEKEVSDEVFFEKLEKLEIPHSVLFLKPNKHKDLVLDLYYKYKENFNCRIRKLFQESDNEEFESDVSDFISNKDNLDFLHTNDSFKNMKCYCQKTIYPDLRLGLCTEDNSNKRYIWNTKVESSFDHYTICKWRCSNKFNRLFIKEEL